jgi:hypothetical protein
VVIITDFSLVVETAHVLGIFKSPTLLDPSRGLVGRNQLGKSTTWAVAAVNATGDRIIGAQVPDLDLLVGLALCREIMRHVRPHQRGARRIESSSARPRRPSSQTATGGQVEHRCQSDFHVPGARRDYFSFSSGFRQRVPLSPR